MALGDVIARLAVSLTLETAAFEKGANVAEKRIAQSAKKFEALGQRMQGLGAKLSVGVTAPLIALGKASVDGFVAQEKAMADVEAALKSMGNASGKTAGELLKTSDALELRSLYDGDVILKQVTANLLTFGNVAGKQFDRAQQAALDMATRLGGEPQAAAIQLGKALNDPVKGITALTRVGVQFTDKQQAAIKALVKTGDVAGAQGIILAEVEKQFKGAAAAAADASPWRTAQVAIGQAGDAIGAAILPIIKPVGEAIASIARAFASLPEPAQKFIVIAGVLAAALGPVLIAVGSLVTAFAPLLASATAAGGVALTLSGALGSLAAVLIRLSPLALGAYLVWKNWDDIAPRLQPLIDQLTAIAEGLGLVEGQAGRTAEELAKDQGWRDFGKTLLELSGQIQTTFDALEKGSSSSGMAVNKFLREAWASFSNFTNGLNDLGAKATAAMQRLYSGVKTWVVDKLNAVWASVKAKIDAVKGYFFGLYDAVVGNSYVPDMVDGIAKEMARLDAVMVQPAVKGTDKVKQAMRDMAEETRQLLSRLFPEVEKLLNYRSDLALLDKAKLPGAQDAEARRRLGLEAAGFSASSPAPVSDYLKENTPLDVTKGLNEALKQLGDTLSPLTKKVTEFGRTLGDAFGEFGYQLKGVVLGAQSAKDALKNFLASLASRLFDNAWGSLGSALKIPGFAMGTPYAPGGLSLVGERGPELVNLPRGSRVYTTDETNRMMGGGDRRVSMTVYANDADSFRRSERQITRDLRRRLA